MFLIKKIHLQCSGIQREEESYNDIDIEDYIFVYEERE